MVFSRFGEKMAAFWTCACKLSWTLFARPGSVAIGGGKKGEFRDWTTFGFGWKPLPWPWLFWISQKPHSIIVYYKSAWMCTVEYFASNSHSDLCFNEIKFFIKETVQYTNPFQQGRSGRPQNVATNLYQHVRRIAHFRVHLGLSIKARPGAQPFIWKWV